jgi:acetyl-CoA C-acetyltransferase
MRKLIAALVLLAWAFTSQAAIKTQTVEYKEGNTTLEGVSKIRSALPGGVISAGNAFPFSLGSERSVRQLADGPENPND